MYRGLRFLIVPSADESRGIIRGTGIRTNHWVSIASLLTGSLVWGLIWFLYRALSAAGVDGMTATWLTHLLPLVVGAFLFRRKWRQLRSNLGMAMAIGLVAGWCNVAYVLAMLQGQVMQVLLLFYLAPLWTVLFAFVLLGEKPGWAGTLVVLLSSGGAAVMLWQPGAPVPVPATPADWLALSAGLAFVLSNVLSRKASTLDVSAKSLAICCGVTLLAGAALLARAQSVTQWASLSWPDWALLAGLRGGGDFRDQPGGPRRRHARRC